METVKFEIEMENGKMMSGELYPDVAPITVKNFISLIEKNFYDGLIFHRVIPGFMIQGGGLDAQMKEKACPSIKGEFRSNGVQNDSASSQFFIMHDVAPHLDGEYAAFGKIIDGLDVVDEIASAQTNFQDCPKTPIVIKTMRLI